MAADEQRIVGKVHSKAGWKSEAWNRGVEHGNQVYLVERNGLAEIDLDPFRFVGGRRNLTLVSEALACELGCRFFEGVEVLLKFLDAGVELLQFGLEAAAASSILLRLISVRFLAARSAVYVCAGSRSWSFGTIDTANTAWRR
jgi:hypothetical protein